MQFSYCYWKTALSLSCSGRIGQIHAVFCSYWDSIAVPLLVPIPVIILKGMVRVEGKCSYCTTDKCCCSLLKPKQRTDIFAILTLNSIQYFSCFQLQFVSCPLKGMKPEGSTQVTRKFYALCCKIWPNFHVSYNSNVIM